jgi:hypothetical protein
MSLLLIDFVGIASFLYSQNSDIFYVVEYYLVEIVQNRNTRTIAYLHTLVTKATRS